MYGNPHSRTSRAFGRTHAPYRAHFADVTDFDGDIALRGRLAGHFWAADNRRLLQFLQIKTHGTIAWNEISECKQRMNGRQAYMKLRSRFMGEDVQHLLRTRAEAILEKIRFDASSKTVHLLHLHFSNEGGLGRPWTLV